MNLEKEGQFKNVFTDRPFGPHSHHPHPQFGAHSHPPQFPATFDPHVFAPSANVFISGPHVFVHGPEGFNASSETNAKIAANADKIAWAEVTAAAKPTAAASQMFASNCNKAAESTEEATPAAAAAAATKPNEKPAESTVCLPKSPNPMDSASLDEKKFKELSSNDSTVWIKLFNNVFLFFLWWEVYFL